MMSLSVASLSCECQGLDALHMTPGQLAAAAGGVADDIGPRVQGAATSTKDRVNDSLPSGVKNAAGSVSERANIAGAAHHLPSVRNVSCTILQEALPKA